MSKRTLEQAFNAVFHDKAAFVDFCTVDVSKEVETFSVSDRTVYKTSDKFKNTYALSTVSFCVF